MKKLVNWALAASLAVAAAAGQPHPVEIELSPLQRGPVIGPLHYGIFFEEINHAGDGGLYAELIRNRSFEDNVTGAESWMPLGNAAIALTTKDPLNEAQTYALRLDLAAGGDGVANTGYWGIEAVKGRVYTLSLWAKGPYEGTLTAGLRNDAGTDLGHADFQAKLTGSWQKLTATFTATDDCPTASFALTASTPGSLCLDVVSLFPPTYKDRPGGLRPELVQMLADLCPRFLRFPGGCFVEGQNSSSGHNRFEWKKTLGPIEERPGHRNQNWGYRSTDGLGFHEYLQLAEDLGAEPLFVCNVGLGHDWSVDYLDIQEYIQEALDAIEYCNGSADTFWGAMRVAAGHPEPFNLRLIEVGNENYYNDHYGDRYRQFYDAIRAAWPEVAIIGNVEAWGTDTPSWRVGAPVDVIDEHYYRSPQWFVNAYDKYDSYDRSTPKVYVGEYAVTQDYGVTGHLTAALGEAVYMLGMERNSDMCVMNSYAPIFINDNDRCWQPDMIRFNAHRAYGTPSYHVQRMMASNVGYQNLKARESGNLGTDTRRMGLSTWSTAARYDNIKVSDAVGNVLFSDDFSSGQAAHWTPAGGAWIVADGQYVQSSTADNGSINLCDALLPDSYTLQLDATKTEGNEGFLVVFNYGDAANYCWWNIGGWNNTKHALEVCTGGSRGAVHTTAGSIVTGQTYRLRIEVDGNHVRCSIDGELIHDYYLPLQRRVYTASSINAAGDELIVKIANPGGTGVPVAIKAADATISGIAAHQVLTSASGTDENSFDTPLAVAPADGSATVGNDGTVSLDIPAYSLSILRLSISDVASAPGTGTEPAAADLDAVRHELAPLAAKLSFLHATTALPVTSATGATIEWTIDSRGSVPLSVVNGHWSASLVVPAPLSNTEASTGSVLTASVTFPGGEHADIDLPVTIAPTDGMYGYLYCYMKRSKEVTNYALGSRQDQGRVFHQLLGGNEIFDTQALATIEGGTRDAYIMRGRQAHQYLMTTTDMCNAHSGVWNNYGIDLLRSTDLIHWESTVFDFRRGRKIFSDPTAVSPLYPDDDAYSRIRRVWAPQVLWYPGANGGQGAYLVYYSLLSTNPGDTYDKIFYSLADKDFTTLTQPRLLYDAGYSVIDADIELNPYDGLWHMYLKHEGASGMSAGVYELTSENLIDGNWTQILHVDNEGTAAVEGSSAIRRIDEDGYNLYYMRYSDGSAYKMCLTDHLGRNPSTSNTVTGTGSGDFQHGSFMHVTRTEYDMLQAWSDLTALMARVRDINSPVYDHALHIAAEALQLRTVDELAVALPAAIDSLRATNEAYVASLIGGNAYADLTGLLANPRFSYSDLSGWSGTGITLGSSIGEHWNRNFDSYQTLYSMPAGTYVFSCSGFYRMGNATTGWAAHKEGGHRSLACLYANGVESPLMSLYDASATRYTGEPYTYPDNMSSAGTAFNSYNYYKDNSVTITLESPADLRLGIRKTRLVAADWTAFDNFSLEYYAPGSVADATAADAPADYYNAQGVCVLRGATPARARACLPAGLYFARGRKIVIGL